MQTVRVTCDVPSRVNFHDLIPLQGDLKSLSKENYDKLKKSILDHGITMPIHVWDDSGVLKTLDGHQRCRVYGEMESEGFKIPLVPIVKVEARSEQEAKKILLTMVSQYGIVEKQGLYEFMSSSEISLETVENSFRIPDINMDSFGLEFFKDNTVEGQCDPDEVPEPKESICKLGDIWILGNHRLMCGDSTAADNIEKLFDGNQAELCFTSPPYADQREYNGGKELSTEHLATFIRSAHGRVKYFAVNLGYSRKDGEVNTYWDDYIKEAEGCGLKLLSWNVWDKGHCGSIGNQNAMFGISHEWVFVFGYNLKDLNRTVENSHFGEKTNHTGNRQKDGTIKKSKSGVVGQFSQLKTVLSMPPQMARDDIEHPARFPVAFPESYIEAMTNECDSVFEPFGGSGSTLIACEKTNRRCFMMELDPHYCSVIIERWQNFTGQQAVLQAEGYHKK